MKFANELAFTAAVIDLAKMGGWIVHHDREKQKVQGHAGFPDLCMARRGQTIFVELKMPRGIVSEEQLVWARNIGGQFFLWHPDDWDEIVRELIGP